MKKALIRPLAVVLLCAPGLLAQHRVDSRNLYERLLCVVPMIGSGAFDDPRRPDYVPLSPDPEGNGIIAFSQTESDDGQYALVELVARDRSAFAAILADKRPNVKVFVKGKDKKQDIEREFRKYKKDLDLDRFAGAAR
jgi:hypothetical protein